MNLNFVQVLQNALLKNEIKYFQKRCKPPKSYDIARDSGKTLKKEKATQKMRKSQTTTRNLFFLLLLLFFCEKTYLEKLGLFCYFCTRDFSRGRLLEISNKATTPTQICTVFVDTVLQSKILGNRLGNRLFLSLCISEKY